MLVGSTNQVTYKSVHV